MRVREKFRSEEEGNLGYPFFQLPHTKFSALFRTVV